MNNENSIDVEGNDSVKAGEGSLIFSLTIDQFKTDPALLTT